MWIPYGLSGQLKSESAAELASAALADSRRRDFLVGFYLSNPVTHSWESEVVPDAATRAAGEVVAVADGTAFLQVVLNAAGKLEELIFEVQAGSPHAAVELCMAAAVRRLDEWALHTGRGLDIAGWRVADMDHRARWRCVPFRPSVVEAAAPALTRVPASHEALARLYRQARNASAPEWRLLCAYAILDASEKCYEPFATTERWLERAGTLRRSVRVSFDMLLRSGALERFGSLEGGSVAEVLACLTPMRDDVLASVGGLPLQYALLDDAGSVERATLIAVANLADVLAREVLLEELQLAREASAQAARAGAAGIDNAELVS